MVLDSHICLQEFMLCWLFSVIKVHSLFPMREILRWLWLSLFQLFHLWRKLFSHLDRVVLGELSVLLLTDRIDTNRFKRKKSIYEAKQRKICFSYCCFLDCSSICLFVCFIFLKTTKEIRTKEGFCWCGLGCELEWILLVCSLVILLVEWVKKKKGKVSQVFRE
jgi:hypothetical protein